MESNISTNSFNEVIEEEFADDQPDETLHAARLHKLMEETFGHKEFRSQQQKEATLALSKGEDDIICIMPTGSGKSLVYQLAAVASQGKITLVVSPLLALIMDQLKHLTARNVVAETINSKMAIKERNRIKKDLISKNPRTVLLYCTPEMLATKHFQQVLEKIVSQDNLAYFVVDECHTVVQWGKSFRPDYLSLGELRKLTGTATWAALTATATPKELDQIVKTLNLKDGFKLFKMPSYRENLFYDVQLKDALDEMSNIEQLETFVKDILGDELESTGCGIIYCLKRTTAEELADELSTRGVICKAYHAGLQGDRIKVQMEWMDGKLDVICATIAFGMGVDKPNVRFVVHWNVSQSLSGYYQESGRAGRDGERAFARIFYSKEDRNKLEHLMKSSSVEDRDALKLMIKYTEGLVCSAAVTTFSLGRPCPTFKMVCF